MSDDAFPPSDFDDSPDDISNDVPDTGAGVPDGHDHTPDLDFDLDFDLDDDLDDDLGLVDGLDGNDGEDHDDQDHDDQDHDDRGSGSSTETEADGAEHGADTEAGRDDRLRDDESPGAPETAIDLTTIEGTLADPADDPGYPDDLVGALDDLGIDQEEYVDTMHRLGLDQAPDGRSVVITLERLGVDAHLEFADVDRLASHLAGGAEIRLSSGHVLAELDDVTDEAVLVHDGATTRLPLEELEDAWTDHGFESVVTQHGDRTLVLLPITAEPRSGGMSG